MGGGLPVRRGKKIGRKVGERGKQITKWRMKRKGKRFDMSREKQEGEEESRRK